MISAKLYASRDLKTHVTFGELMQAHAMLDAQEDAEAEARERARQRAAQGR